jgi:hypothetical protein
MEPDLHDIEVALDILDQALHQATSDHEALASIHAWRRKTSNALIREYIQPIGPIAGVPESVVTHLRGRILALEAEVRQLKEARRIQAERTVEIKQELYAAQATPKRRWWVPSLLWS